MSLLPCYSVEARVEHVLMSPGGMRRGGGGLVLTIVIIGLRGEVRQKTSPLTPGWGFGMRPTTVKIKQIMETRHNFTAEERQFSAVFPTWGKRCYVDNDDINFVRVVVSKEGFQAFYRKQYFSFVGAYCRNR